MPDILLIKDLMGSAGNLIVGVILGAIVGVKYSLRAQRPKIAVTGGGSRSEQNKWSWSIGISNNPSFFGEYLDGETARNLSAHIRLDEKKSRSYPIYWDNNSPNLESLAPGQHQSLNIFHWSEGSSGYYIVDHEGQPVARFQAREMKFVVSLIDSLSRETKLRFVVEYDDSHLRYAPSLQILFPKTLRNRISRAKMGLREFLFAFTSR